VARAALGVVVGHLMAVAEELTSHVPMLHAVRENLAQREREQRA
jgi:hypothetical protein